METVTLTFPWEPDIHTSVEVVRRRGLTARVRLVNPEGETIEVPVLLEWLAE